MTLNIENMSAKELLAMIADDVYQGKSLSGKDALIPQLIDFLHNLFLIVNL